MVKNKLLKKVAAAAMAVAMTFATVPMGAMADHPNPHEVGQMCNNTYRTYSHTNYVTNMPGGSHITVDGYTCLISNLVYEHEIRCTSCGYYFGKESKACTTVHSKCGTTIVNH